METTPTTTAPLPALGTNARTLPWNRRHQARGTVRLPESAQRTPVTVEAYPFRPFAQMPQRSTARAAGDDVFAWSLVEVSKTCYGRLDTSSEPPYHHIGTGDEPDRYFLARNFVIDPGEQAAVRTGLNLGIPDGYEIEVRPRSGYARKHQVSVTNSPGTIDQDFCGVGEPFELVVLLENRGREPFVVTHGMKIAQLCVREVPPVQWVRRDTPFGEGHSHDRRGGFGSTGQ